MKQALSALKSRNKGFTLIELLVVIGILAILLAIVLVAINPARQFSMSNNAQRSNDVTQLLSALNQYAIDNNGSLPGGITDTPTEISTAGIDICSDIVPVYMAALPVDPLQDPNTPIQDCGTSYSTNYFVAVATQSGRITVSANGAELGQVISVTR